MDFAFDRPAFTVTSYPGKQLECLFYWSALLSTLKSWLEELIVAGKFASGSEGICLRQFSKGSRSFAVLGPIDHRRPLGVTPGHSQGGNPAVYPDF